jgi:hypothetical protein
MTFEAIFAAALPPSLPARAAQLTIGFSLTSCSGRPVAND